MKALGAVQVLCNRTRGEGGVCKNMILYDTGGRGGMPKYDVVLCGGGGIGVYLLLLTKYHRICGLDRNI